MKIKFLKDERGLLVGDYLVIADLHLGYKKNLENKGYVIPNQRSEFIKRIKKLKTKTGAKKLIILGDIKHNIPYASKNERYEIPKFFRELSKLFEKIIVIKGNHDGKIEPMIHEENIEVKDEFIFNDVLFIHGHKYPSNDAMKSKIIVMAHTHPTFKLKESAGIVHNYPCWIIGRIIKSKLKRYKDIKCEKVIIMPAFNKLLYGYNKIVGPLAKAIKKEEVLLLDFTKVV